MPTNYKITTLSYYGLIIILTSIVILYPPINVFVYDVFGYYLYLPLKFKYHDLTIQNYSSFTQVFDTYHPSETFYQAVKWDNGNWVMRYPIGLSVLFSPFYFIADIIAPYTRYPADGFSRPYQLSILYGGLFYTLVGLYFVKNSLITFFNDKTSAISLVAIGLGTNYFFHVSLHGQGAMSHNLLFTLYAIIFYLTIKWHNSYKLKYIIFLAVAIGLAALCRASEIICVIIPLLYGVTNWQDFKNKLALLFKYKTQILSFCFLILSIGFIQLVYWKFSSGKFIINPYGSGNPGEGFELLYPHLLKVFFSFRKGWFIYTPLMAFTMFGFWRLYKSNKSLFVPIFIYFLVNAYIVSSWSCWWYGSCFGVRALIPSYAVLIIPFGYCIDFILKKKLRSIYLTVLSFFIGLNLFQSWQAYKYILDPTNMSRSYYFSIFFQTTSPTPDQTKLLLQGKFNSGDEVFSKDDSKTHSLNYANLVNFENSKLNSTFLCDTIKHSGKFSLVTNNSSISSYSIEIPHEEITQKTYTWIKASVWVYSTYSPNQLDAVFTIQMKHKGYIFKQKEYKLNTSNFKAGIWNKLEYYYLTPDDLRSTKDLVSISFTNKNEKPIFVDDLMLQSYEPIFDPSVF